jgi:hypothetical protein
MKVIELRSPTGGGGTDFSGKAINASGRRADSTALNYVRAASAALYLWRAKFVLWTAAIKDDGD